MSTRKNNGFILSSSSSEGNNDDDDDDNNKDYDNDDTDDEYKEGEYNDDDDYNNRKFIIRRRSSGGRSNRKKKDDDRNKELIIPKMNKDVVFGIIKDLKESNYPLMIQYTVNTSGKPKWNEGNGTYYLHRKTNLTTKSKLEDLRLFLECEVEKSKYKLREYEQEQSTFFYDGEMKSCSPDDNDDIFYDKSTNLKPITQTNEFHKVLALSGNQYIHEILGIQIYNA